VTGGLVKEDSVAWDFSTEPEFAEKLDWVQQFCRDEVEPLDLVFPGAAYSRDPKAKALADPLKQRVIPTSRRCGRCGQIRRSWPSPMASTRCTR
jgi:hypothetical protein